MIVEERIQSLVAFLEERQRQLTLPFSDCDESDRQSGGRFGPGNDCGGRGGGSSGSVPTEPPSPPQQEEDTGTLLVNGSAGDASTIRGTSRTNTSNGFPAAWKKAGTLEYTGRLPGVDGVKQITVVRPKVFTEAAKKSGFKSVAAAVRFGCATAEGSVVNIEASAKRAVRESTLMDMNEVHIVSTIPVSQSDPSLGDGRVHVILKSFEDGHTQAHYQYFQVSDEAKRRIKQEQKDDKDAGGPGFSKTERDISNKIFDIMLTSLEEAEKAGVDLADTDAAGSSSNDTYKGYKLWGRFGMDGEIAQHTYGMTAFGRKLKEDLAKPSDPDPKKPPVGPDILTEEFRRKFETTGQLNLQELLLTRKGERYWIENGGFSRLALNFKDTESLGYKRYAKLRDMMARARERGSRDYLDFVDFVTRSSICVCPSEWRGFRQEDVEQRIKSLAEFLESRNCGTGSGGFQKGNTCAGGLAADVATGAATGAVVGAAHGAGATMGFPAAVAAGAGAGALAGAAKGFYDNKMRPTRAAKAISKVGSSDEKVAGLVKDLGGSPRSIADAKGRNTLAIRVKDDDGKNLYDVRMTKDSITVRPAPGRESLTDKQIENFKKIAAENHPHAVKVVVDKAPPTTLARVTKAGASITYDATLGFVAGFVGPMLPSVAGAAAEAVAGQAAGQVVGNAVAKAGVGSSPVVYGTVIDAVKKVKV
jgi:hypothetical protein